MLESIVESPKVAPIVRPRSTLRAVSIPTEHGGWGLTLEPVLLGLLVKPSVAGLCLGLAGFLAFLARTPLKVLLVDAHRGRHLERTGTARRVLAGEGAVLALLVAVPALRAPGGIWIPLAVGSPLLAVELSYDMRSRGRRLVPEMAGAIGIGGFAAAIALAGGAGAHLAFALWLIVVARATSAIITVRDQVGQIHGRAPHPVQRAAADLLAVIVAASAVAVFPRVAVGAVAIVAAIIAQRLLTLRPTPRAVILGLRQTAIGLSVVALTVVGLLAT